MDPIPNILLRTTLCTIIAGCIASILLRKHTSSNIQRIAAVLVLLQGWLVLPIVIQVPVAIQQATAHETTAVPLPSAPFEFNTSAGLPTPSSQAPSLVTLHRQRIIGIFVVLWVVGIVAISIRGIYCYVSLVNRLPFGSEPTDCEWIDEWKLVTQQVNANTAVCFRITDNIGPLVCYIPFTFLILAPRRLWASFDSSQRIAILQHELAHVSRGDLWKSVAVHFLALPQWFNPFAWQAVRRFDEAAEWACDDLVVQNTNGTSRAVYPSALLSLAKSQLAGVPYSVAASNGNLSTRIRRLVQPRFKEESQMTKSLTLLLLIAIALMQTVRVRTTIAEEPALPTAKEPDHNSTYRAGLVDVTRFTLEHRENLATTGLLPYRLGGPDVLTIRLANKDSRDVTTSTGGEHLVKPDGTIEHNVVGQIRVHGKTAEEVKEAIEIRLRQRGDERRVEVNITHNNSKPFYVIVEGENDHVARMICTASSNVRTALESLDLKLPLADRVIFVSRPSRNGGKDTAFPIDWNNVSGDMNSDHYFPLYPSDRVFVTEEPNLNDIVTLVDAPAIPAVQHNVAKQPKIQLNVQVIDDTRGSLSEFDELMKHGPLVANTQTTLATLRILNKNKLTDTLAVPTITCRSGQVAELSLGEVEMRTVASRINDSKIRLEARVCTDATDKTKKPLDTTIDMAADEMILMKADDKSSIYFAITAKVLR